MNRGLYATDMRRCVNHLLCQKAEPVTRGSSQSFCTSPRYAKQMSAFSYQRDIELIASRQLRATLLFVTSIDPDRVVSPASNKRVAVCDLLPARTSFIRLIKQFFHDGLHAHSTMRNHRVVVCCVSTTLETPPHSLPMCEIGWRRLESSRREIYGV